MKSTNAMPSDRTVVLAAMLLAAMLGFAGINSFLPGGGDNAAYIAEAEAWLSLGHRADLFAPGAPTSTLKPPLFSLLLAGVETLFGRNIAAMKALLVLFAAGSVWAAAWALRAALREDQRPAGAAGHGIGIGSSAIVACWFALAPTLLLTAHDVLSDVPFTFFALLSAGLAVRAARPGAPRWQYFLMLLALAVACQLRTAGVILICALAGYLFVEALCAPGARRQYGLKAAPLVLLALFLLWRQSGGGNYLAYTGASGATPGGLYADEGLIARVLRVAEFYLLLLPIEAAAYIGFAPLAAVYALAAASAAIVATGMVVLLRQRLRFVPVVWLLYQGAMLLWPFLDARFYLPVLPLYLCLFYYGLMFWIESAARRSRALSSALAAVLLLPPLASLAGTLLSFGEFEPGSSTAPEWLLALATAVLLAGWNLARPVPSAPLVPSSHPAPGASGGVLARLVLAVFLSLALARTLSENVWRERLRGPAPAAEGWPEFYAAAEFIQAHAQADDIVVSAKPSLLWIWSGRRGLAPPATRDAAALNERLRHADWAVIDHLGEGEEARRFLLPYLARPGSGWAPQWAGNETLVWRRRPGAAAR